MRKRCRWSKRKWGNSVRRGRGGEIEEYQVEKEAKEEEQEDEEV